MSDYMQQLKQQNALAQHPAASRSGSIVATRPIVVEGVSFLVAEIVIPAPDDVHDAHVFRSVQPLNTDAATASSVARKELARKLLAAIGVRPEDLLPTQYTTNHGKGA